PLARNRVEQGLFDGAREGRTVRGGDAVGGARSGTVRRGEETMPKVNRRRVLRGLLNGGAVTLALPLLDCFLNGNGTALADGKPMPIRFGTWYWQLGMAKSIFVPKKLGG